MAGRILISAIFILSGLGKIFEWSQTAGYMESKGFPVVPLFQIGAIGVELAGGLSILLGFKARWGAVLLFLYLIPVSLVFHDFWAYTGMERNMQMAHFFKNVAIMGGMLLLTAFGPGGYSVDSRVEERQAVAPV